MNGNRILAIVLRHLYVWPRGLERFMWSIGWPMVSLFSWGLTASYLQTFSSLSISITTLILGGIIFWSITTRSQLETTVNFMDEMWNKNLINIFSSPLTIGEFLTATILLDLIKLVISVSILTITAYLLYSLNLIGFGWYLPLFVINLLLFGWSVGFFIIGLMLRLGGRNIQELAWALLGFVAPFSCVYYPITSLPVWAQKIAIVLPTTYVFEEMRRFMFSHEVYWENLLLSLALNLLYLILSLLFIFLMFEKARETGNLTKMEG